MGRVNLKVPAELGLPPLWDFPTAPQTKKMVHSLPPRRLTFPPVLGLGPWQSTAVPLLATSALCLAGLES